MYKLDCFADNQDEALNKNGHQNWYRLVLHDFHGNQLTMKIAATHQINRFGDTLCPDLLDVNGCVFRWYS